jgi:hypothetical protein
MYFSIELADSIAYSRNAFAGSPRGNSRATEMLSSSAVSLYASALGQGRRGQRWSILSGGTGHLFDLVEIEAACTVLARCHAGVRTVPIDQIRGSEGRSGDFDRDFNPLQDHNRGRWLRVAKARQQGVVLPPVDLIQVGDVYFVRDGHHRISVARAAGQLDIEAEVVVWQVDGSLPWETRLAAPILIGQGAAVKQLFGRLRRESARLQVRLLKEVGTLLIALGIRLREYMVPREAVGLPERT